MAERTPEGFPMRTLGVQRTLCAVLKKAPANLPAVIEALFRSYWVDRNFTIGEPDGFAPVLETVLGKENAQEILSSVSHLHFLKPYSSPFSMLIQIL